MSCGCRITALFSTSHWTERLPTAVLPLYAFTPLNADWRFRGDTTGPHCEQLRSAGYSQLRSRPTHVPHRCRSDEPAIQANRAAGRSWKPAIWVATGYSAFANFLDDFGGSTERRSRDFGSPVYYPTYFRQAYFFQDRWQVNPDLTLTLGVRYENFGTPMNSLRTPAFTGLFNIDPTHRQGAVRSTEPSEAR